MKNTFKLLAAALLSLQLGAAHAQLQLPQPSPKASVMQQVGLTDITIDYSSPAVKGRTIWGELVSYDKVWRAGANAATKITFSKDVTIEGTNVAKGSYSIFIIPSKADWTIAINKDVNASEGSYKESEDVVRIKSMPKATEGRERLTYNFTDFNEESAIVNMEWEKVRVSFKVAVATGKQAAENIDKTLGATWMQYNNAARYYYDQKDYNKALEYSNMSLSLSNQWFNNWVKAQVLAAKGMTKDAYAYAVKAKELGDKNPDGFFFKSQVEKALEEWKPAQSGKKK
jgi:tetratricopeptide (TPR) repeat protein